MTEWVRLGVRIPKSLRDQFREDVKQRKGGVHNHLRQEVINALREYLHAAEGGDTHDRLRRLENRQMKMMDVLESLEGADTSSQDGKKKKISDLSTEVENKLSSVVDELEAKKNGSAPKIDEQLVERAIRDGAGVHSDPSIRQYKNLLIEDETIFPHPTKDDLVFTNSEDFVRASNALAKGAKLSQDDYDDLVDRYGEDWWRSQLNGDSDDREADA